MESQHAFDTSFKPSPKIEWILHTRIRTRSNFGDFFQWRGGALVDVEVKRRLDALGGYYYLAQEVAGRKWDGFHRFFGGGAYRIYDARASIEGRTLVERFVAGPRPDFTRFRQRLRLGFEGRVTPVVSSEWLADTHGLLSTRLSGGIRWRPSTYLGVDISYLCDMRRPREGAWRHILVTSFHFRRKGKQEDADL